MSLNPADKIFSPESIPFDLNPLESNDESNLDSNLVGADIRLNHLSSDNWLPLDLSESSNSQPVIPGVDPLTGLREDSKEIIFVDETVTDYQSIVAGINTEVNPTKPEKSNATSRV